MSPIVFLSYSRKDLEEIGIVGRLLNTYGIQTWQDINNLGVGLSEPRIRRAIQSEVSGLLFYSTPNSLTSKFIKEVEIWEAEKRFKKDSSLSIVPVFRSSIEDTNRELADFMSIPISNFNGAKVEPPVNDESICAAAHRAAEVIWEGITLEVDKDVLTIGLTSKQTPSESVSIDLNFSAFFVEGYPSNDAWNVQFPRILSWIKTKITSQRIHRLRLYSFAHLSLGLLFGFVFRDRTGITLEIVQTNKAADSQVWKSNARPADHDILYSEYPGTVGSKNLIVKANFIVHDDRSVSTLVSSSGLDYRAILEVEPQKYPYLLSNGQAVAIARELSEKIKELHGKYGTNTVHLFLAGPLAFALFLGHNLNSCGFVQCYEYDNSYRQYRSSCMLR